MIPEYVWPWLWQCRTSAYHQVRQVGETSEAGNPEPLTKRVVDEDRL